MCENRMRTCMCNWVTMLYSREKMYWGNNYYKIIIIKSEKEKKMWYIYTMEYYSAIKKNKIMPFAATWMELETLILSEVGQNENNNTM